MHDDNDAMAHLQSLLISLSSVCWAAFSRSMSFCALLAPAPAAAIWPVAESCLSLMSCMTFSMLVVTCIPKEGQGGSW